MTTFTDKTRQLPEVVQEAISKGRSMSYSQAGTWHDCPLQGKFERIDKIKVPVAEPILHGNLFDAYCEGDEPDLTGINPRDAEIIQRRSLEYQKTIDTLMPDGGLRLMQYPVYAPLSGGWFSYGFLDDLLLYGDKSPFMVIDRKFSKAPWADTKVKYYYKQGQNYLWGLAQMGILLTEFTFLVMNLQAEGVQSFTYKPRKSTVKKIGSWLQKAVDIKRSGLYPPTGGRHCGICNYRPPQNGGTGDCDRYLYSHLTSEDS